MSQITCITLCHYDKLADKAWAFGMMQWAHGMLGGLQGLQFYKLMGSGKGNGFNPWPDWSTYALLTTWSSEQSAREWVDYGKLMATYRDRCDYLATIYCRCIHSHGLWAGVEPFQVSESLDPKNPFIAVTTRAVIKWRYLRRFWKYVPTSSKPIHDDTPGLLYTKGVGEVPAINMATLSIWDSLESVKAFAYQSPEHQKAIKMTRELGWYSEELFARWQPYAIDGYWPGLVVLSEALAQNQP